MDGRSYIISGRNLSLLLLVVCYLCCDLAGIQIKGAALIGRSRKLFAEAIVSGFIIVDRYTFDTEYVIHGVGELTFGGNFDLGWSEVDGPIYLKVKGPYGTWEKYVKQEKNPNVDKMLKELQNIALDAGLSISKKKSVSDIFMEIEKEVNDKLTKVPGIGLSFPTSRAIWITAISAIILLAIIRNRLRNALLADDLSMDVPWLILGRTIGVEKFLSALWLLSILVAPWIIGGALIGATVRQPIHTEFASSLNQTGTPWIYATLILSVIICIMFIGGWLSITTGSLVLRLRSRYLSGLESEQ